MASGMSHVSGYSGASSAMYQSTLASSGIQRETFEDRLKQTRNWIWNAEEALFMGKPILDWVFLIIGYLSLYVLLFGFGAVCCGIFYWVIDWNDPTLQGPNSILQTPGLGFRPQPDVSSTLVRFIKGDGSTYVHYLDHIEAYIQYYENELQQGDNFMDCSEIRTRRPEEALDKVCVFDPIVLGDACVKQQNYGFDDGQPCILLKLNKLYNWVPEEYKDQDQVPELIREQWKDQWSIFVRCDGDDDATRENMGELLIYPEDGFHFKYFPFRNQQGFRSPLAFLRFENPHPGILLMMTCRAFAKNIIHDNVEQVGQVHFELMVD